MDSETADLFAFLLESSQARRAVVHDDDLREAAVRPVDTAATESAIDAERIAALTEYLSRYADTLVLALLLKDASAIPDECEYVTDVYLYQCGRLSRLGRFPLNSFSSRNAERPSDRPVDPSSRRDAPVDRNAAPCRRLPPRLTAREAEQGG
jgi:hypothetical protein